MLQKAGETNNMEIAELVRKLRIHETIEEEEIYPAVLQVARSVRDGMGI